MNKYRKNLKEYSILILILAAFSLVRMIVDVCMYGFDVLYFPIEGASEQLIKITAIISFVIAILLLLPDVYVGIIGIKEANNPTGKKAHIVWSLILAILSVIATISAVVELAKAFSTTGLLEVLDVAIDTAIFFAYYLTAKKVFKCR